MFIHHAKTFPIVLLFPATKNSECFIEMKSLYALNSSFFVFLVAIEWANAFLLFFPFS